MFDGAWRALLLRSRVCAADRLARRGGGGGAHAANRSRPSRCSPPACRGRPCARSPGRTGGRACRSSSRRRSSASRCRSGRSRSTSQWYVLPGADTRDPDDAARVRRHHRARRLPAARRARRRDPQHAGARGRGEPRLLDAGRRLGAADGPLLRARPDRGRDQGARRELARRPARPAGQAGRREPEGAARGEARRAGDRRGGARRSFRAARPLRAVCSAPRRFPPRRGRRTRTTRRRSSCSAG